MGDSMYSITINLSQIEWETDKAYLIKVPKSKYKFWFPKRYTQSENSRGTKIRLLFEDDKEYKIFKNGQGKYNKHSITSEKMVSCDTILELFGYEEVDGDIIEDLLDD